MPVRFLQKTLPNGLHLVAEPDPAAHSAAVGFFVRTGARDESPADMGVSHFLEHMIFKGTETRSAAQVDLDFDSIGADHNAYTTSEMTAFWTHSLPEHLPRCADVLADIMRPALRPADFDDEKGVILEEIAMYEDQPFWVLYERAMEVYYRDFPLSRRVLGTRQTITGLTRDRMVEYFQRRYAADNTIVAMAGRLDFEAMCDQIARACGAWRPSGTARAYPPLSVAEERFTLELDSITRHYALLAAPAPAIQDERRYAAGILSRILGGTVGSRFYWALIETGLAEEASAQYDGRDGTGEFLVTFTCSPEDAQRVEEIALGEIERLAGSLTADDVERVQSRIATSVTLAGELPAGRMQRLGRLWASLGEYRSLEEELRRLTAVTVEDVRAVCEAFPFAPRVIGHLRPKAAPQV